MVAETVVAPLSSVWRTVPSRDVCRTPLSGSTARPIGSPVSAAPLASVTRSKLPHSVAPHSPGTRLAAHLMPPSRWARNCGSAYDCSVWPPPVYQERPPSYVWHQAVGWSSPSAPPLYVLSSSVASTWTSPRGFERKLYHSSKRCQRCGRWLVDGWLRSATFTVA